MGRTTLFLIISAVTGGALPLAAQSPPRREWIDHLYPYAFYSSIDGFWGGAHYDWSSPIGFVERPEPNWARAGIDASASTQGSYAVVLDAQAPAYWEGWRFALTVSGIRANRLGYYGQGNAAIYSRDSINSARPYFYRVSRTTRAGRLTLQRLREGGPHKDRHQHIPRTLADLHLHLVQHALQSGLRCSQRAQTRQYHIGTRIIEQAVRHIQDLRLMPGHESQSATRCIVVIQDFIAIVERLRTLQPLEDQPKTPVSLPHQEQQRQAQPTL